jgi:hypothetical protein
MRKRDVLLLPDFEIWKKPMKHSTIQRELNGKGMMRMANSKVKKWLLYGALIAPIVYPKLKNYYDTKKLRKQFQEAQFLRKLQTKEN